MKAKCILLGLATLIASSAFATKAIDDGSKFGTGEDSIRCIENVSLYDMYYKIGDYDASYNAWKVVFDECPKAAGRSFYGKGAFLIAQKMKKETDQVKKQEWFDLLMKCYEQRIQYFGKDRKYSEEWIRGRQAMDYIAYSNDGEMLDKVLPWLKQAVEFGKYKADADVVNAYFQLLEKQYEKDPATYKEGFINEYLRLGEWLDQRVAQNDKSKANYELVRNNVDNIFSASSAADCETLAGVFAPKVEAQKADATSLTKIIQVFRRAGCKESEVYFTASRYAHKLNPTAETAAGCAYQALKHENYQDALRFFDEALGLETVDSVKYDYAYAKALVLQKLNRYAEARTSANQAIQFDPDEGEPYILIATLYASSDIYPDDPILAKTVYWAAVDKLMKAKQVDPDCASVAQPLINTYRHHFPAKEDVFFHHELNAGEMFHIGGWINESVRCRD